MALMDGTAGTTNAPPPLMTEAAAPAATAASHPTEPTTAGADAAGEAGAGNGEEGGQPPKEEQQELSREVEAALLLMEGHEADEAKFAGLLLLVKHLQQSQAQQQGGDPLAAMDARARLLAAVGPHFLARLLATPSPTPPQQAPQPQSSMPGFAPLALAVLRTLAQDPSLLPRLRLPALLAPLAARLEREGPAQQQQQEEVEAEEGLKEDCLSLLHAFAAHDPGAAPVLAKVGAGRGVVRCLVAAAAAAAPGLREEMEKGEGDDAAAGEAEESPLVRQACAALEALVAAEGRALSSAAAAAAAAPASTKGNNKPPSSLVLLLDGPSLAALTSLLATERRPALRLALLPLLATTLAQRRGVAAALLSFHQRDKKAEGPLPASFPASLRAALLPWLHGSVREAPRDQALALAVHALGLWGQTWAVEDTDEVGGRQDKPEEGGGAGAPSTVPPKQRGMARGGTAGVLVSALAAEARMLADELEGLVAALHDPELRADANLQRRLERARRLLPVCLDGLDSVLRFLCGAGDGECPLPALLEPDPAWSPEDKAWVSLPSPVLLGMRSAIHGAVAGVLKMLQDAGSDLLPPLTNPPGPDDNQPSLLRLLPVYRESARFLSAVLAEDPHCLSPTEALATLPVIRALVDKADHDDESDADATEPRLPPHLPLPWVARALDIDPDDATGTAEAAAAVDGLVEQGFHLWLLDQLALPFAHPAAWPLTPRLDGLALLHAMLVGGGATVPCVDHGCSLARHPKLVALLPHLASTVGNPQAPARLRLHAAWFLLAAVVGEEEEEEEKGGGGTWCGADDAAVALLTRGAVVEGLADVAVVGRRAGWGEAAPAEAEEDEHGGAEEDRGLWARLLAMVASSAAASDGLELAARVPAAAEARYGRKEGEAVRELLLEVMAGQEAEAAVRRWRR